MLDTSLSRFRRIGPRVPIYAFCSEFVGQEERHSIVVDLSEAGLRLRRPERGPTPRRMQLEFELPDFDEMVWAEGEVCHDIVENLAPTSDGLSGLVRTSGVRIRSIADSHRRLLREYVHYLRNEVAMDRDTVWCSYLPGVSAPRSI